MPLTIGPQTSLQQLRTYSQENVGTDQKIYAKTTSSCWSGEATTKLHGATFRGGTASFNAAKQDVLDLVSQHIGQAAAQEITRSVYVANSAMTGGQLRQIADRAIVVQQLNELTQSVTTGSRDHGNVASPRCQRNGEFDRFLANQPFQGLVSGLAGLASSHDAAFVAREIHTITTQLETLDRALAKEFLGAALSNPALRTVLSQQAALTPPSFTQLLDEARGNPTQLPLHFDSFTGGPGGITVDIGRKLGAGGMGGAVYLATDRTTGAQYALKIQPQSNYALELDSLQEEVHTPGSLGSMKVGKDAYMLMKLGEKVDFSKLTMGDLRNVFQELDKAHHFSDHFMGQEIPEHGITHEDIHQGNLMMVDGKLSLIDFGKHVGFTEGSTVREVSSYTEGFIKEFQEHYPGKDKLNPKAPDQIDMRAINCATLSRQLILRILFQVGRDNGMQLGLMKDPGSFYKSVKDAMPRVMLKAPAAAGQVAVLLSLYERQMAGIINGEPVFGKESAAFFGDQPSGRSRANTM